MNCCYFLIATAALPVVLWKRLKYGKYRQGWDQKLWGNLPTPLDSNITSNTSSKTIWVHAVSVGEVLLLRPVIEQLKKQCPDSDILITTTTETGYSVAKEKFSQHQIAFFPLDFTWSVRNALNRVRPSLIVLVELELWPNLIREAHRRNIPLAIINGRLSQRSFQGYMKIRPLMKRLLQCFSLIAVQTAEYRQRFLELGANPTTTITTGSLKFDGVETSRSNLRTRALAEWLNLRSDEQVFIAGSTQDPEEQIAIDVYLNLKQIFPTLRLILVPRHPERCDEIERKLFDAGLSVLRRSRSASLHRDAGAVVGLMDTVGELGACWGLADIAFVGGSFGDRGGQNMLEPAAYGACVCFGPNTSNFRQVVELLLNQDAAKVVHSQEELEKFVQKMLTTPLTAQQYGQRAQRLVMSQQGATEKTLELVCDLLPATSHHQESIAA